MVQSKYPFISIIIVTFNSQKYIKGCLDSVLKTDYPNFEVIVVDNNSTDETVEIVSSLEDKQKLKIIKSKVNLGYAGGNNLGVEKSAGNLVAIINPDTQVSPDWLKPLVHAIKQEGVACCQPKIRLSQRKDLINLTGKTTHYLGFEWLTDYQKPDYAMEEKEITSFSGSSFLTKKKIFQKLGGFDEDFFMYYEDGDLSWRLRLGGYKILLVPGSIVYHEYKYQPEENCQKERTKFYLLERNRLMMIIKNYSWKSLFLLFPAICFMEKGMVFYFITKGWWKEKIKEYSWILKNMSKILRKRKKNLEFREVPDRQICQNFVSRLEFKEFDNFLLRYFANPVLNFYWQMIRNLL